MIFLIVLGMIFGIVISSTFESTVDNGLSMNLISMNVKADDCTGSQLMNRKEKTTGTICECGGNHVKEKECNFYQYSFCNQVNCK